MPYCRVITIRIITKNTKIPVATLNVSSKDSPYALIDKFFPEREENYDDKKTAFAKAVFEGKKAPVQGLNPKEVWLSDGGLLVLKGGLSSAEDDGEWEPLDDYEAPYREPKLPPPDFIPDDTGVGVPLPPDDDDELYSVEKNEIKSLPKSLDKIFDEEKHISEMENFHSVRNADGFYEIPKIFQTTRNPPLREFTSPTPLSIPPTEKPYVTTAKPEISSLPPVVRSTTLSPIKPTPGFFVHTSTPESYSYAYQTKYETKYNKNRARGQFVPSQKAVADRLVRHTTTILPPTTDVKIVVPQKPGVKVIIKDKTYFKPADNHFKKETVRKLEKYHKHHNNFGMKIPKLVSSHEILSNEIDDEFENRRRSNLRQFVNHRNDDRKRRHHRKLPFNHYTTNRSKPAPFLRHLRQQLTDNKRRLFRHWREFSAEKEGDSVTVASNAISRLTKPVPRARGNFQNYHFAHRSPRQRFSVRRSGTGGYSSFFCGGRDCKSWGYSFRS